jgi:hypothetical protein
MRHTKVDAATYFSAGARLFDFGLLDRYPSAVDPQFPGAESELPPVRAVGAMCAGKVNAARCSARPQVA